jgi:penicillin G amidase
MMRIVRWFVVSAAVLILVIAAVLFFAFRASLPKLDGEIRIAGLSAPAFIERDGEGTPTIKAKTRGDLAFVTGYAHAQDRFFQMDLMRRAASGELAELLGSPLIDTDKRFRMHGFRQIAQQIVEDAPEADRVLLRAYVDGVNAGLRTLSTRPWEYLVLSTQPSTWQMEDCLLAAFSMYLNLNDSTGEEELARSQLRDALPPEVFAFLYPLGTEWDAPISGGVWRVPPIPPATTYDLRRLATQTARLALPSKLAVEPDEIVGSNSWAVARTHSATGTALLANDMHLGLRLPNTWYRARLIVEGNGAEARDLIGVTLPGLPMLVAGSNKHVAWGYTNSYGDWTDLVVLEMDPANSGNYLVGDVSQPIITRREEITVRGAPSVVIEVQATRWGPIVRHDEQNRPLALAWTAHHRSATNLRMLDFESATTVEQLLDAANTAGGPVQNVVAADTAGRIGWSLMGRVPVRTGYDSTYPASWRSSGTGWIGWREPNEYPRIVDPAAGRLWTANTRTIDAQSWVEFLGDGGHDLGARAAQIRDSLLALPSATIADLAKIQTDDRALFLMRWRDLLLDLLNDTAVANAPARAQARELIEKWSARARAEDAGYRIVRAFRLRVRKDVFDSFTVAARTKHPEMRFAPTPQFEGPLWQLVTQRPPHLLDPRHASWEEAMLASFDAVLTELQEECSVLAACTWGRQNKLEMRHPLSSVLPFAAHWLDMPAEPMPGDAAMPRVQGTQFGASQRLVVSPGQEDRGLFEMPGGPVDHPLSPFYRAGHEAWVRGEPQPLLPGPPRHRLQLASPR